MCGYNGDGKEKCHLDINTSTSFTMDTLMNTESF